MLLPPGVEIDRVDMTTRLLLIAMVRRTNDTFVRTVHVYGCKSTQESLDSNGVCLDVEELAAWPLDDFVAVAPVEADIDAVPQKYMAITTDSEVRI
jgi:hypothetical protein